MNDGLYPICSDFTQVTKYGPRGTLHLTDGDVIHKVFLPQSFPVPQTSMIGRKLEKLALPTHEFFEGKYGITYSLNII